MMEMDKKMDRRRVIKNVFGFSLGIPSITNFRLATENHAVVESGIHGSKACPETHELFLYEANRLVPELRITPVELLREVKPIHAPHAYLRWQMQEVGTPEALALRLLKTGDTVYLDFGHHVTGYLKFDVQACGINIDAPARLRLIFGETPGDVAEDLYPYHGTLAQSWLPDEVYNVDPLPQRIAISRRHAFRYVRLDVVSLSEKYAIQISNCTVDSVSSALNKVAMLPEGIPECIRQIDQLSVVTLHDCMQTVFEDGPRRDQRLWIGDFRLQALTNYSTYRNFELVKRCLYLLAAFPQEDGMLSACVFEKPSPHRSGDVILDYAVLFNAVLEEYLQESGDIATCRALWSVALRQIDILSSFLDDNGIFVDPKKFWIFVDWEQSLHRDAAMQGILIYSVAKAESVAERLGDRGALARLTTLRKKMTKAALAHYYDTDQGLFISGPERQTSLASQVWLILADVLPVEVSRKTLRRALESKKIVLPATPYLYHYVVEALIKTGLYREAGKIIIDYWGGMVERGADTFWEVYDPADSLASPYHDVHINSFCHAWSCTPAYFIRHIVAIGKAEDAFSI